MLAPAARRSTTADRACAVSAGGLPNCLPVALARIIPECVRCSASSTGYAVNVKQLVLKANTTLALQSNKKIPCNRQVALAKHYR